MKIKGLLQDLSGAVRVIAARKRAFRTASLSIERTDPIGEAAHRLHPDALLLAVTEIKSVGRTAKTVRLEPVEGSLPPFYAGQYISLLVWIDGKPLCRPYSISSAPFEARQPHGFVEITVRRAGGPVSEYIFCDLKVGDRLTGSMGHGQFYYEPLRDARHIVALAGGVGVTPFVSMAKEIRHGTLDADLTILYGVADADDILLKEELDALCGERVRVVYVYSGDAPGWTGERGYLSAELIQRYAAGDCSCFVCGPQAMYRYARRQLQLIGAAARRVRFAPFGQAKDIAAYPGYPAQKKNDTYRLTVVRGIRKDVIPANACESLVAACERAGILLLTDCRSGECGFCHTKVLSGDYFVCPDGDGRRAADRELRYVHACATYPLSDMTIRIPIV